MTNDEELISLVDVIVKLYMHRIRMSVTRNDKIKYVKFGSTDMMVSEICAGTMMWGSFVPEEEKAHSQLDRLWDLGVNFIDTAELYPVGFNYGQTTEKFIGNWLHNKVVSGSIGRENIYIATKCNPSAIGIGGPNERKKHSYGTDILIESCKNSIERLKCDYIDLYYLHWPTRDVVGWGSIPSLKVNKPPATMDSSQSGKEAFIAQVRAVEELFKAGLIKHWALSNETAYGITMFCTVCDELGVPRPVALQNDFSLLNRSYEGDTLEACHRFGILGLPYGVLSGGTLTGKYFDSKDYGRDKDRPLSECRHRVKPDFQPRYGYPMAMKATYRYIQIAEKYGITPCELALAWANSRWYNGAIIIGTTTTHQVEECVNAFKVELSAEIIAEIDEVHEEFRNPACFYTDSQGLCKSAPWLGEKSRPASTPETV